MRTRQWTLLITTLAGCGLFPSLDGLTGGDASTTDATTDASTDSAADVVKIGDASDASDAATIPCEGGLTSCGSSCVDVSSSGSNCGACGHDCLGGSCASGQCQPVVIANAQNGAYDLAVGGGEVYWVNYSGGSVAKCTADNCGATVTVLATGRVTPEDIAIDGTNVYWSERGGAAYCARAGCGGSATTLVSGITAADGGVASNDGVAVGGGLVFFPINGSLLGCAIGGCGNSPTTVTSASADDLTTDSTNLYGTSGSTVFKCPLAGCSNVTRTSLVTGLSGGEGIAVDGTNVYFAYTGAVGSCPLTGCSTPTVLAANQTDPNDITSDGVNVYWTDATDNLVLRCSVSGCNGTPTIIAQNQAQPKGIGLDAKAVYWTQVTGDAIVRLAK